jgi:hypothetical protein
MQHLTVAANLCMLIDKDVVDVESDVNAIAEAPF